MRCDDEDEGSEEADVAMVKCFDGVHDTDSIDFTGPKCGSRIAEDDDENMLFDIERTRVQLYLPAPAASEKGHTHAPRQCCSHEVPNG